MEMTGIEQRRDDSPVSRVAARGPGQKPVTARGLASRNRLKAAALAVLDEVGYRRARVSDITERAGVASGLFYRYFDDLTAIAVELTLDLMAPLMDIEALLDPDAPDRLFDKLLVHSNVVVRNYVRHPGLMRSRYAIAEDSDAFRKLASQQNEEYLQFLLTDRWTPNADENTDHAQLIFRAYILQGICQGPMTAYSRWANSSLAPLGEDLDSLSETLAIAAYRSIEGRDPADAALRYARPRVPERGDEPAPPARKTRAAKAPMAKRPAQRTGR